MIGLTFLMITSCGKEQSLQNPQAQTPLAGESCKEDAINAQGCEIEPPITFNIVNVPGYPGCSFPVTVEVCIEIDPLTGSTYLTVGDYNMGNHNCQPLIDSLLQVFMTPSEIDDNAFIARFDKLMYTRIEDYLFAFYGGNIMCGGQSNGIFSITFHKQACSAICFYEFEVVKEGDGGGRAPRPSNWVRTSCSTEGCCRRETTMCFDPATNTLQKTTNTYTHPGSITPVNACAGGTMLPPVLPASTRLIRCNACSFACSQ